jgi:ricin-type beta-trefoil lectin protein
MNHVLRMLGSLQLLGLLAASVGPANAAQLQVNGNAPYICAAVQGSNIANTTPVIAYSCSGGPNDHWQYIGGQFQGIGTSSAGAKCLDVQGQGTTPGTLVDLYDCVGQLNQQWEVVDGTDYGLPSSTLIMGVQSLLCLDSAGGPSVGGGTQLIMNTCTGSESQNWILREMQFQLVPSDPYLCASVGSSANGSPVISYSCDGAPSQLWNYVNGEIYGLGSEGTADKCLTSAKAKAGSLVELEKCSGKATQQWFILDYFLADGDITNAIGISGGLCLDNSGGPPSGGGTQLVINPCSGAASQNWNVR